MNKIRILFTISAHHVGGGETYVLNILKNIDREKYYVGVVAPSKTLFYKSAAEYADSMHSVPFLDNADIYSVIKLFFIISKYDIVHANLNRASFFSGLVCRFLNKFCVASIHGIDKKFYYRFNTKNIFLSDFQREHYKDVFRKRQELTVKIGIDTEKLEKTQGINFRKENNISEKTFLICVVARLHELKGHFIFLESLARFKEKVSDFKCIFFGDGPEKENLQKKCSELDLQEHVIFYGNVERPERFIKNSFDLFVLPSQKENIPVSILEAMYLEIPVISSNVGGVKEEIDFSEFIVDDYMNPEEFYKKIKYVYYNRNDIEKIKRYNKQKVLNEFSLKRCLESLEEIYEKGYNLYRK